MSTPSNPPTGAVHMSDFLRASRPMNLVAVVLVSGLLAFAFIAWKWPLQPHGQHARAWTYEEVWEIGGDETRPLGELLNADIRGQVLVEALKQRLIALSAVPGPRGENARALLEKIRR